LHQGYLAIDEQAPDHNRDMKKIFVLFLLSVPGILIGQSNQDSLGTNPPNRLLPEWRLSLDLLNFYDNYPAILFAVERTYNNNFAVEFELGPTLAAEVWDEGRFESYFGYKSSLEGRLYFSEVERRNKRAFFAVDFSWSQDFYQAESFINDNPNFTQLQLVDYRRNIFGTHLRLGRVKYYSNDKFTFEWSFGFGREFFDFQTSNSSASDQNITTNSILDPFSINFRIKVGLVLKQYKDKPLYR
jgi:hypothetical protein